ncbi:DNA polymerase delta small subunit [Hyphopichia burtonii NRRL Y-1933]|uniref:DNA-directed DNA polymerase n=1 Tax=Hyphopichia burtonii NRRL Y-1933 TaxID=984485 RepID=A0A1E4RL80_9ASCO|nr:DNA polymerase delta small subunit [Hyphopichia burtonii NRRL Y-1933]ODV67961.1 DNA polymerase delta small subunit [Hyphopichia burtonii NRRL Y-1933]
MSYTEHLNSGLEASAGEVKRTNVGICQEYDKQDDFTLDRSRPYDKQYYSMYQYRLSTMKKRVDSEAMDKWGDNTRKVDGRNIIHKEKILDIQSGELCWVSGTVFSDMSHKLNILKDVEKGTDDILPEAPSSYTGEELPIVMLEDESGRAVLHNEEFLKKNILVTGCIIAVLGIELQAGIFEIMDVVYPKISPQKPLTPSGLGKIAIISGLDIKSDIEYDLKLELLKQYLCGYLGNTNDKNNSSGISQLIVAGNSVASIEEEKLKREEEDFVTTNNYGLKNTSKFNPQSLIAFNKLINDLLPTMPVLIMPGSNDPAEINLPQQKLHPSLLGSNKQYLGGINFHRLTNPAWIELENGLRILGTCGQNVDDILKYLPLQLVNDEHIEMKIMNSSIKWQNIIPTAPDTLYSHPFDNFDPYLLRNETPHLYFVGNQKRYDADLLQSDQIKVKLISVPKFSSTGEIVLVDTQSLQLEVVKISL